jgi:hypothetical protein
MARDVHRLSVLRERDLISSSEGDLSQKIAPPFLVAHRTKAILRRFDPSETQVTAADVLEQIRGHSAPVRLGRSRQALDLLERSS